MALKLLNLLKSRESIFKTRVQSMPSAHGWSLVYEGPFNSKIRLLKYGSVATFVSSVALSLFAGLGSVYELQKTSDSIALDGSENSLCLTDLESNNMPKYADISKANGMLPDVQARINRISAVSVGAIAMTYFCALLFHSFARKYALRMWIKGQTVTVPVTAPLSRPSHLFGYPDSIAVKIDTFGFFGNKTAIYAPLNEIKKDLSNPKISSMCIPALKRRFTVLLDEMDCVKDMPKFDAFKSYLNKN